MVYWRAMRALIQRVSRASVGTAEKTLGSIEGGMLVLLGVTHTDSVADIDYLSEKILNLRIFEDLEGKMNLSLLDTHGQILVVSQFTLYADTKKGRRPAFVDAAKPDLAQELYKKFVQKCRESGLKVDEGEFGAHMFIDLINDGPVTIMLDSNESKANKDK